MAKPVNAMTGDAPDGQNPDKKYVPEKTGRFKYTPPPPPKPDPRDAEIFTEEKLRRSGGKMKEPPMGLDSKKRGGVIKRRFASGGEIMDEYDGAMGRGTDTPDKKIAREKSDAAYASDVGDKAAGLKASKNDEPVGFFKRLMMGNIDKPGSEAYEKLGAGRGRADAAREDANKSARNERESARTREANMALDDNKPSEPVRMPSRRENIDDMRRAQDYAKDVGGSSADKEKAQSYADEFGVASGPSKFKLAATKPKVPAVTKTESLAKAAAEASSKKSEDQDLPKAVASAASIPTAGASKAPAETGQSTSGPNNLEKIILGIPGGGASLAGIAALGTAGGVGGAKLYKMYKAAQRAKDAAAAARFSQPSAREVTKDLSKYTGKEELEAAESAMRGANSRRGIQERNPSSKVEYKRGGNIKAYASGGSVSASSRGDGCAQRGKTRGTMR